MNNVIKKSAYIEYDIIIFDLLSLLSLLFPYLSKLPVDSKYFSVHLYFLYRFLILIV